MGEEIGFDFALLLCRKLCEEAIAASTTALHMSLLPVATQVAVNCMLASVFGFLVWSNHSFHLRLPVHPILIKMLHIQLCRDQ